MTSLYNIANDYQGLMNMDLDEETLLDTLESLDAEFDVKVDNICHVLANLTANINSLADEELRLASRRISAIKRMDDLKDYLRENMEKLGKKKVETLKFTVNCVAGRDKVIVDNEGDVQQVYKKSKVIESLDKKMIIEALKQGIQVNGASLGKSKSSLRIK